MHLYVIQSFLSLLLPNIIIQLNTTLLKFPANALVEARGMLASSQEGGKQVEQTLTAAG